MADQKVSNSKSGQGLDYQTVHQQSLDNPAEFWSEQAKNLPWYTAPKTTLEKDEQGSWRWFPDGEMNTCYMAVDHHVEQGRGDQVAIYYDSPVTMTKRSITYKELQNDVATFAGVLADHGVVKGDTVVIYMPMSPQSVIAMLACARLGAVHSVVFGGFAPRELAVRIDDAKPKVILTASCGIELHNILPYKPLLDEALFQANHQPDYCIVFQRSHFNAADMKEGRDVDWKEALLRTTPAPCTPVKATDPLYILYTSGTTGTPKGVVRDNGGHAVAMKYSMDAIYDQQPGDVFWAASDVGWVVGHSYIVYAPLIAGLSTILYEGKPVKTPDAGAFWRVCSEYGVKALFAAPTAFRAIRKEDPECEMAQKYDLSKLQYLFAAGERLDPATWDWLNHSLGLPVIDHWWQTETGWAIAANPMGIEPMTTKPGSSSKPSAGFNVKIFDADGNQQPAGEQGSIVIQEPLPPGCLYSIWGNHQRFRAGYMDPFPGYYLSGDGGYIDEEGYLFVMGRTDDIINIAGHRLSTGEMEEVVASHPAVAECAVIGIHDELRGQLPVGFVLLKDGHLLDPTVMEEAMVRLVRKKIGPVACFKKVMVVNRLPKTRSGKILRKLLRQIADGESYTIPSTIDDPECIDEISMIMAERGLIERQPVKEDDAPLQ
ncbi:propionyl-CoA synthetase [Pelagibaculum spongiae]|uniref:Propionyl-CoA synthetase n=1 Tax=Pelagibaculum spongiae TaxID=2080658 RepID=A0A2V1H427_9GAMM|nr:propionyl-CoA synthetase [Pelagibaculum spongiae]PVZ71535.1 propionyl-CoA synthetase [Pelagibaculum spongiae]